MIGGAFKTCGVVVLVAIAVSLSGCSSSRDDEMSGGGMTGPAGFVAGVDRLFSEERTVQISDDGMTAVTWTDDGFDLTVNGITVSLTESDFEAVPAYRGTYAKALEGGQEVFLYSEERGGFAGDPEPEFDYLDIYGWSHADYAPDEQDAGLGQGLPDRVDLTFVVHGTLTDDMPVTGTATYDGRVVAREWPDDAAVLSRDAPRYRGDFSMLADFGASGTEVTGEFSNLERMAPGEAYREVPGSVTFSVDVTGNHLSATVESIDEGPLAGYRNVGIRAAFFGPAAAEVGGVFEGANPTANTLLHGWFAGSQP